MTIFRVKRPMTWGELDLPLFGLEADWHRQRVAPPATWSLALDPERLWFVAGHGAPARVHPKARPGRFLEGLWEHDVAELFLADPADGAYLELNLAPNGAWWSCAFRGPRERRDPGGTNLPGVETFAELAPDGTWLAAMAIPRDTLRELVGFGDATRANVTFILGSPAQRFLSAAELGGGEPDFHRPERFRPVSFHDAPLPGAAPGS